MAVVGLDKSRARGGSNTTVHADTPDELKGHLPKLDPKKPTARFTTLPHGYRPGGPVNAEAVLEAVQAAPTPPPPTPPPPHSICRRVSTALYQAFTERQLWKSW